MVKKGYTLIELMIVLGIVGIFLSFSYPAYLSYLTRTRRLDGQTALFDLANRLESYYFTNHTYESATIGTGQKTDILASPSSAEGWYQLSIVSATADTFLIQATPQGQQAEADKQCQSLTLNNIGKKEIADGPYGKPNGSITHCF